MATPYPLSALRALETSTGDLDRASDAPLRCDACDRPIEGEPGGEGAYLWLRGGVPTLEKAPLCADCATAIGLAALRANEVEEEDG